MRRVMMSRDLAIGDGYIYLYSPEERVFIKMDRENYKMECLSIVNCNDFEDIDYCIYVDGRIYANSISGKYLVVFEPQTGQFEKYSINLDAQDDQNVSGICYIDGIIYVIGKKSNRIVAFSPNTGRSREIRVPDYVDSDEYLVGGYSEDQIWIFPCKGNIGAVYNTSSMEWTKVEYDIQFKEITNIEVYQNSIYILESTGDVYRYDTERKICEHIIKNNLDYVGRYTRLFVMEKMITLLCSDNGLIVSYSPNMDKPVLVSKTDLEEKIPIDRVNYGRFYGFCEDNDWRYYANRVYNKYLKISKYNGMLDWFEPLFPTEEVLIQNSLLHDEIINESKYKLESFVNVVVNL